MVIPTYADVVTIENFDFEGIMNLGSSQPRRIFVRLGDSMVVLDVCLDVILVFSL